ncbi:MAG: DUF839 domain-containing protein [Saprospiraceae bacterium]|nr:DUF839 domain-containing protein [Saprospiraceae bacterium]
MGSALALGMSGIRSVLRNSLSPVFNSVYGELIPDPNGIIDLPTGFSYRTFSRTGEVMDDGLLVPGDHDGMAAFPGPAGMTILIRNHELSTDEMNKGPFGSNYELLDLIDQNMLYDPGRGTRPSIGGTTTLLYDTRTGELVKHFLSLCGTNRNCAGGPTPWNTWISCEENVTRAGAIAEKDHGFNFEVPVSENSGLVDAIPLTAMGRFNHEAVAVDPESGIVYQTEDRDDGLIYRFIPNQSGKLAEGGRLQALVLRDMASADTRNWSTQTVLVGQSLAVEWIDMEDVLAPDDDLRNWGFMNGAAKFARGEGMWFGNAAIYFACTNGGTRRCGQIWKYTPSPMEGKAGEIDQPGRLELFVEPNECSLIERADNLTVAPWGDLIICEDGDGSQFLDLVTPNGEICKLAKNSLNTDEFAGATFSPDGTTLFVNIQKPGITIAITGPWQMSTSTKSVTKSRMPGASLRDPFPNPFASKTEIPFTMQRAQQVELLIFNTMGAPVKRLYNSYMDAGEHKALWDGTDHAGRKVPYGTYFVQLRTKTITALRKIVHQ